MRSTLLICSIALFMLFSACDKKVVFVENKEIPNAIWQKGKKISFTVDITDTLTPINYYLSIRNKGNYPFNNVYLFMSTLFPNGERSRDTLDCVLADKRGKWKGSGIGDIKSLQIQFMKNVRFVQIGKYTFEFEQAMRSDNLEGIYEFGIKLEKGKPEKH